MKCLLLSALVAVALAQPLELDFAQKHWHLYKMEHGKKYENATEDLQRKSIFLNNVKMVQEHNAKYEQGLTTYLMRINHFSDMTPAELKRMTTLRFPADYKKTGKEFVSTSTGALPKSIDWTKKGAVTPIKNQGVCGSCWAFSATGSLEAQMFLKTKKLVSLSEQNLVDCSRKQGNQGCDGGLMDYAFTYIKENDGIDTEEAYPYEGHDLKCRYKADKKGGYDNGFVDIPEGKEDKLQEAVANVGPVAVAIDADHNSFFHYWKGVYTEANCKTKYDDLDHGVLAVGYGKAKKGGDYWIVKNSWGTQWGDQGWIWMARNRKNMCGIATAASYPAM